MIPDELFRLIVAFLAGLFCGAIVVQWLSEQETAAHRDPPPSAPVLRLVRDEDEEKVA